MQDVANEQGWGGQASAPAGWDPSGHPLGHRPSPATTPENHLQLPVQNVQCSAGVRWGYSGQEANGDACRRFSTAWPLQTNFVPYNGSYVCDHVGFFTQPTYYWLWFTPRLECSRACHSIHLDECRQIAENEHNATRSACARTHTHACTHARLHACMHART